MQPISVLFINLPTLTYTEMVNRLSGDSKSYEEYVAVTKAIPLGILYLSAHLKGEFGTSLNQFLADYSERLETLDSYDSVNDFIIDVAKKSIPTPPDIVAISAMFTIAHQFLKNLVKIYKSLWPKATFIVGGVHATNTARHILQTTGIDYVFRGEGELALAKFIKNHSDKQNQNIQGVYGRNDINSDFRQICELVTNLDELPYPNWELINLSSYVETRKIFKNYSGSESRVVEIMGSRGCPFKCTFCSTHTTNNRTIRYRSVENILGEVNELYQRTGITRFVFNDDIINIKKSRFFEIVNAFRNRGLKFQTQGLQCNQTTKKMIDSISKTSNSIIFPIEHGSPYVQKHIIKKNINLERVKELVAYSHERGLIVRTNFIFGFPNETKEMMNESADYMRALNADWHGLGIAVPLPGTEMYDQFVEMGFLERYDEELWESTNDYAIRTFDTNTCTADDLKDFNYRLNIELNFVNNYNLRSGQYARAVNLFNEALSNYPLHVFGLIALCQAYKGLNDMDNCKKIRERIYKIIAENESVRQMYEKYMDLLKDTEFYVPSIADSVKEL